MPRGDTDSDTTDSDFPQDGENAFAGRSHNPSENGEQEGEQRQEADTTASTGAEPAENGQDQSTPDQTSAQGDEADTTAPEPSAEEETEPEAEAEGEGVDAEGEAEPDAEGEGDGEPEEDVADEPPFKYHGSEPEEGQEDFVFISEEDPSQRYEDVESMVNAHEELLSHTQRQQDQLQNVQEQLANERAEKEGEVEELRTRLSLLEEHLPGEDMTEALAKRHMPEKFQGMTADDVPEEQKEEFYEARAEAKFQAKQELQEAEEAKENAKETVRERRERLQNRFDEAEQRLEEVDMERLGMDGPEDREYVVEALNEFQVGEGENAKNALDIAYDVFSIAPLLPDEVDVSEAEMDKAFDLIVNAVGARARELKAQQAQERASKIKRKAEPAQKKRGGEPEKATEESARREPGDPFTTFKNA